MNGLIAVYYELISQEIGSDGKESRKSILSLDYCLEIYLGYKTDFVPGSALTKDDKVSFQDCLLHDRYGLPVYIVNTQTNKFVVLRPDDIDLTEIFHKLITSFVSKAESEKQLTIDILRIILDTIDTEWDMKVAKTLLTYQRSYSELENLGINIDSIKRDNQKVLDVAGEWQNAMIAAEDIITLRLKQRLSSYQEELESLTSLKQRKERVWDAGIKKIEGQIELTQDRIRDTEFLMGDVKGQKVKQMIKRKAKSLFEENRVKRRKISSQGRPSLLDSEDEEFVAKCIEDKATYHGRRHDTVMYTNKRVKKSDLLDIANYKLLQRGKQAIRSANTVYNRSRPRNIRSLQARRHCGKGLFCFKKPPKAEDNDNENTHFQRGHIKNIKLSFFSNNVDTQTRNCCFMRSTDDKAYLRPGTSEGFEKSRNVRILTLTDVNRARALPKYDWPEKLVYITPAAHRIFTKKGSIKGDEETLKTDEDHHFVYVRPKATIGSSGSVWASEIVDLRHRSPDVFEMPTSNEQHLHRSISRFLCTCS